MLFFLPSIYVTMAGAAGYLLELISGGLGLIRRDGTPR